MSNFRYHFIGRSYVLTEQEHEQCVAAMKAGNTKVVLRAGKLMIDMALLASWNETQDLTDAQTDPGQMRLPGSQQPSGSSPAWRTQEEKEAYFRKYHAETYAKMGWAHEPESRSSCKYPECGTKK